MGENYSEDNPYRILVDKYEALLKIQQKHNAFTTMMPSNNKDTTTNQNHGISLHEELQMSGQFSSFNGGCASDSEDDEAAGPTGDTATGNIVLAGGPCKYSETETTSSSGFSDETSNKCTQTETFFTGSFLCTISDGDDCRFSIYDDASPVESRFRKTPEYRQLFREIFAVLKRAAEAKDEGERLPLLQDDNNMRGEMDDECGSLHGAVETDVRGGDLLTMMTPPKVPPATPACENNPLITSIESVAAAAIEKQLPAGSALAEERKQWHPQLSGSAEKDGAKEQQQQQTNKQDARAAGRTEQQQQNRRQRDIIEELASTVKHKKHVRNHRKSASSKQQSSRDISHLMEFKWTDQVTRRQRSAVSGDCSRSPSSSHRATWCVPDGDADAVGHGESATYTSLASQEVAKLKLLEKSYAEVLRLRKPPSNRPQSQYFNRM